MQFIRCFSHSRWTSVLAPHRRKLLPAVGTRPENWTEPRLSQKISPRSLSTAAGSSGLRQRERTAELSDSSRWSYNEVYRKSLDEPEEFWHEQAERITWFKKWDKVLVDAATPYTKWFVGGETNICYNAVDRHVDAGYGDQTAIIHDSPVTNTKEKITYRELQEEVAKLAEVFIRQGVKYGDRIVIYMPMIPQAVIAMLACARVGAIHGLVFGGFASKELAVRINHAKPKLVVSASCGVEPSRVVDYKELLNKAISLSDFTPERCIIYNRPDFHPVDLIADRDICWHEAMAQVRGHDCIPVHASDPVYLLYSSGTTGQPKAIVRPSGSHAVVLNWSMKSIYGIDPGEAWWAASDLGWVVGHSYICWAPLLTRCQTIVYEGKPVGTPDPGAFFRVLQEHDVTGMFTAPTALRAIMKEDEAGDYAKKYPLTKFRTLFVAGEHCDQETMHWSKEVFKTPVLDNWWQTVKVLNDNCEETKPNELGRIAVKLPLPPGAINTLWENDERYENLYFKKYPGFYDTMDAGCRTEEGYISVQSRADDVINVAGHRIAASAIEEAIIDQGDVVECAVIPLKDALKGLVPVGLVVIKNGTDKPHKQIIQEVVEAVRSGVGPVAAFKKAIIIGKLPKTRSGKIPRQSVADMANGKPFNIPPTIEDASAYGMIREELVKNGILQQP